MKSYFLKLNVKYLFFILSYLLGSLAFSAGGLPFPILDPDTVGWRSVWGLTDEEYHQYWEKQKRDGYFVIDQEIYNEGGITKYAGIFQKNTDGRAWASHRNLTHEEFSQIWLDYRDRGFRLIDQEVYKINGYTYYAGAWIENREGLRWASLRNLTNKEYSKLFHQIKRSYMPVDVEGYLTDHGIRYAVIWVENVDRVKWVSWRNMSEQKYKEKFAQYKKRGYRILDIETYNNNKDYAAIWIANKNKRYWQTRHILTAKDFRNQWETYRDEGYRLTDIEIYQSHGELRFAGVWRQVGSRMNWKYKQNINNLLDQFSESTDVPGVTVAIADNGNIEYLHGHGFADAENSKVANSRTIYRLASVSKAIAGVMSLQLQDNNYMDVTDDTSDYIDDLPSHHTHSIEQLLSNRSCMRGYYSEAEQAAGFSEPDEYGDDHFNWSVDAMELIWNNPLKCIPGSQYIYSTHGYVFVASAMEYATGISISELTSNLNDDLGLSSFAVEDRSQANYYRAEIYNTNNTIATADDISWKSLGGGLEASAYDMLRLMIMLNNGQLLNDDPKDQLWDKPDALQNYALGWNTGTQGGEEVYFKGGDQRGADSHIRIYPDRDLAIVVLSNRREVDSSNEANDLAINIGTFLLNQGL